MLTNEVFGINNNVREYSYVDRGNLDEVLQSYLTRDCHIAIKGPSKSGKTWLRKKALPEAITVQCRYDMKAIDIYRDVLAQLGIKLELKTSTGNSRTTTVSGSIEGGIPMISKAKAEGELVQNTLLVSETQPIISQCTDLRAIANEIKKSGKRLVIEDFHYLPITERQTFAFDLKALWDYGVYIIILGVWSQSNFIQELNPDLTGRIQEISIEWNRDDLKQIIEKGSQKLNIEFSLEIEEELSSLAYSNAGILQKLTLESLDQAGIRKSSNEIQIFSNRENIQAAAAFYADQVNPLYQEFAKRVSTGIRNRKNATGIYAHALAVILQASDDELIRGLRARTIHSRATEREPRIQYTNLKRILEKVESLQVDKEGRGMIIAYNGVNEEITIIDRQLLLYRKYSTVTWPWEGIIAESKNLGGLLDSE